MGGNKHNCGTWMDKMGESGLANNKSVPATPRDGAPIEIVGLLKSTLRWLTDLAKADKFPDGVTFNDKVFTWKSWNDLVQSSFEKYFYIPLDLQEDHHYSIKSNFVNRRGIYKDTFGSSHGWTDYQLRPNICIAMAVAPELFSVEKARKALSVIEQNLIGPLGMRTLDPTDWNYRPNYINSVDSSDYTTSKGFNYHQGPVRY
jgi:glycogen debranching enzyme